MYKASKTGFTRQPVPSSLTLQDGSTTTTERKRQTPSSTIFFPDVLPDSDSGKQKNKSAQKTDQWYPDSKTEPNFTEHEVEEVISRLDEGKCPGPDGIHSNIVKRMHKYLPKFWWDLYIKCFTIGCFPKVWKNARAIAISKEDKIKLRYVEGYRGISLLSIPGKCLENIVTGRLIYYLETSGNYQHYISVSPPADPQRTP